MKLLKFTTLYYGFKAFLREFQSQKVSLVQKYKKGNFEKKY